MSDDAPPTVGVDVDWPVFLDLIQPGEQGWINRTVPGQAVIGLPAVRKILTHK